VAGAEVVDLRPELGAYFGVETGVLVVDVAPGTPAAIAGLLPGDVVTRIDRVGVRTVEDLRFGVAQAGDTLPLTLIRRGSSLQVLLRRR
jgi:S1-C subfamily serine protease